MTDLSLIKKLREATGCGISDCNKALLESKNSYDDAVDWLRKKGLSSAAKKSTRITTEGLVGVFVKDKKAVIIEVNSETDFVAKNDKFQNLVSSILNSAFNTKKSNSYLEDLKKATLNAKNVEETIIDNISVIGENLQLRRANTLELEGEGLIVNYLHTAINQNMGRIGVIVALKSSGKKENLEELGKKISMHIAATKPEFLKSSLVPADKIAREKEVLMEQAKNSGKPINIIEKMIEGRMNKFYEENCLLDQLFVMDDTMKVKDLLSSFKRETGNDVEIQDYCFYVLGEGLEKKENNFAEEVASMTNK